MPKVVLSRKHPVQPETFPARIKAVEAKSPAGKAGVEPGWELVTVNGLGIPDVLAYRRELAMGPATIAVRRPEANEPVSFEVGWEEPGLEFDDVIFDGIRLCANHCDFCYIHQMPKGMRKSLYLMDDDFRTSFLYGSFVTLTNLSEEDVNRILDEHLSPLYVSVHTADEALRGELMKWWPNKVQVQEATAIRGMIERLEQIELYTQLVLVPGRNDGDHLERTIEYLASRPNVVSVAVVPVGLTDHRGHLAELSAYRPEQARDVLARIRAWQSRLLESRGTRFVFASDEFYLLAGADLPAAEEYEGYPMLENGVGMVRDFLSDRAPGLTAAGLPEGATTTWGGAPTAPADPAALPAALEVPLRVILATGRLFAPVLEQAVAPLRQVAGLELEVRPLANRTFGEVTTVAGLLAGRDVLSGIRPGEADLLLLSPNMFKYGTDMMLDDRSLGDLRRELKMRVEIGGTTLTQLYQAVLAGQVGSHLPSFGFSTHAIKESAKQH